MVDDQDNGGGLEKNLEAKVTEAKFDSQPNPVFEHSRFVCQIIKPTLSGTDTAGTGFLVGPDLVLTCFHVVEGAQDSNLACRFDVKLTGLGDPTWGPTIQVAEVLTSSTYSLAEGSGKYTLDSEVHPELRELDYALLRLVKSEGLEELQLQRDVTVIRRWLKLPSEKPKALNSQIYILQHANGQHQQGAVDTLLESQPALTRLRYLANTDDGSSGSPCFQWHNTDDPVLAPVAMHNYGDPIWHGKDAGFNQGIPVYLIKQDILRQKPYLATELDQEYPSLRTTDADGEKSTFSFSRIFWVIGLLSILFSGSLKFAHDGGLFCKWGFGNDCGGESVESSPRVLAYRKACDLGDLGGCKNLGLIYNYGEEGVAVNLKKALELYQHGCTKGDTGSCGNLGQMFLIAEGVEIDIPKGLSLLEPACGAGISVHCRSLGNYYSKSDTGKDLKLASDFYRKACDLGDAGGCVNLGLYYFNATDVENNYSLAADLFRSACDAKQPSGCKNLADYYYFPEGGYEKDYELAAQFYKSACDFGSMSACGNLGLMYDNGEGVEADSEKAIELFQLACDGGAPLACRNLANNIEENI